MLKRIYDRYRRPLLLMAAFTVLFQSLEIGLVELSGDGPAQGAFAALANWYALVLFVVFPTAIVWHSAIRPETPPLVKKPADAFTLGMFTNGLLGAFSLALGMLGVMVRWVVHGWSGQTSIIAIGSLGGFVLVLPLGGVLGWTVFRLIRPRLKTR